MVLLVFVPLLAVPCSSLAAFKIYFLLAFIFSSLVMMGLGMAYLMLILLELLASVDVLFSSDSENFSQYFFECIFPPLSFWDSSDRCVGYIS